MSRYVTSKKRLQGRLCKTLKRCKYDSVVACEQALCLGKEFAPRPKDCSRVITLGLLMIASPILCTTHISKFVRPHEKRQCGVFKNMHSEDRFQKTCVFGDLKRLFCAAFSAPDPPGGLSMRTRRLWDRGFEVLDFRTSSRFRFKSNLEDPLLKALNHLNLQSLTIRQEQVNAIRNVVDKSEMTGSLKSPGLQILRPPRQSFLVLLLRPPGGSKNENVCVDEQRKAA